MPAGLLIPHFVVVVFPCDVPGFVLGVRGREGIKESGGKYINKEVVLGEKC